MRHACVFIAGGNADDAARERLHWFG